MPAKCGAITTHPDATDSRATSPFLSFRGDGSIWGTLFAIDPVPHDITAQAKGLFVLFARLIARELDRQEELEAGRAVLASERDIARLREKFIAIVGHDLRLADLGLSKCCGALRQCGLVKLHCGDAGLG